MEDLLLQIVKDAGSKQADVRKSAQEAYEFLETQQGRARAPPYQLRQKCLDVLQLALQSNNSKLKSLAINGFQWLLRDDRFHSNCDHEDELQWLPSQMLNAVSSMQTHPDEIQVDILKVLLNMSCANWWSVNSKLIQEIFQLCLLVYIDGSSAVRTAAQATASQTLRSFCSVLEEEANDKSGEEDSSSVYDEVIPVFNFLCKKLGECQSLPHGKGGSPLLLILESMLTFVSCLPVQATENSALMNLIWQKLCPSLVAFLGSPRTDKNIIKSQRSAGGDSTEMGRGSGCLASAPTFTGGEAKMVYSIAVKLVELVGSMLSLRPMLESLFHRMLLYPPPQHRLEALKAIKEVLKNPELLLKFAGPVCATENQQYSDLSLLTLVMDSIVESCQCNDATVCSTSVACVVELLGALELLCVGGGMSADQVTVINQLYKDLVSSDYTGPLTYRAREEHLRKLNELSHNNDDVAKLLASKDFRDGSTNEGSIPSVKTDFETRRVVEDDDEDLGYQGDQEDVDGDNEHSIDSHLDNQNEPPHVNKCKEYTTPADADAGGDGSVVEVPSTQKNVLREDNNNSDSSELTEGPEDDGVEEEEDFDVSLDEAVKKLAEQQEARRERLPKTLLGEESGQKEREQIERLCEVRNEFAQLERYNARHFVATLKTLLPSYLVIRSSIEVDEALQEFASKYCAGTYSQKNGNADHENDYLAHITIINADGVYLATYAVLTLNLKLVRSGYYANGGSSALVPLSEEQFVEEVHGSGVLVYLSTLWLSELYQQVLETSLLEVAGYHAESTENTALINLLTGLELDYTRRVVSSISDLDGLDSDQPGDQLLSDYRRLEKAATNTEKSPQVQAGMKFSRRLLTGCWDNILEVLSVLLNGKNACGVTSNVASMLGMESVKEEHRRARDAIASSLEGLQKAARLCNILGLQSRCGAVFLQLADASCPGQDHKDLATNSSQKKRLKSSVLNRSKTMRLHSSYILSMDVLLNRGLLLGSHSPDCWRHVFRCCMYVADLEHAYFSQSFNAGSNNNNTPLSKLQKRLTPESQRSALKTRMRDDLSPSGPVCGMTAPVVLSELIQQITIDSPSGIIANNEDVHKIICGLSQQIDRLFDDAASKLNLQALVSFFTELCAASQSQLFSEMSNKRLLASPTSANNAGGVLLLYRLGDVMLKCVRSGRPLIHIMKSWSVVGPHFMEAACHKDRSISKKAVTCIHDIVTALLAAQSELPHFHFNEALFKPFENLLCLELCDVDVQDQIISSICEFVEGSTTEIRSGWRPLFGALRAVRPSTTPPTQTDASPQSSDLHIVMDVFEAFLHTENVLVFANAAVDCILCLLKHVRGSVESGESSDNPDCDEQQEVNPGFQDLCLTALKYVHRCSTILASMYSMPTCPIFHSANRIKLNSNPQLVDPIIPDVEVVPMDYDNPAFEIHTSQIFRDAAEVLMRIEPVPVTLDTMNPPSGILHVWFLLLEGLAGAISTCEKRCQPLTMESLFVHLRSLYDIPGPQFGIYCVNHLLLPMLQSWLRRTSRIFRGWDNYAPNFKQCCGLATDLVVEYITKLADAGLVDSVSGVSLMLKQLMLVMLECIAQPTESISRLGCACIRHLVVSGGSSFTPALWELSCLSLHRACTVSLHSLYQLMSAFHVDSEDFYGDIGQVKVATRKDCTCRESQRLQQLANQVFLLDNQWVTCGSLEPKEEDEDRSFIFLLYPPNVEHTLNPDLYVIRVSFRSLVVGLLSHQILVQSIGTLLLQGSTYIVPSLANVLLASPAVTPSDAGGGKGISSAASTASLPGVLPNLSSRSLKILLDCLSLSYRASCEFDLRPGLKFLIQKVAELPVCGNLYKQAGASWTIHAVTLLHLALSNEESSVETTKMLLTSGVSFDDAQDTECRQLNSVGKLRDELMALCSKYTDLVQDKDGIHSQTDKLSDQPIFFLIAQPDDFPDVKSATDAMEKPTDDDANLQIDNSEKGQVRKEPSNESLDLESSNSGSPAAATGGTSSVPLSNDEEKSEEKCDKVYSVATRRDIESMMTEYKKRKNQNSMPLREKRRNPFNEKPAAKHGEMLPPEMEAQKRDSILKDSEAHLKVSSEMLLSVFDLLCQLDDAAFVALLPLTFPMVRVLTAHAHQPTLRSTVAEFLQRVALLYRFDVE